MVLIVELLLAAGILVGVYRLATRPGDRMSDVEPDRRPDQRLDGPLTADDLVAMHLPVGFGYRKIDVDRLLDRVARQLPRATYEAPEQPHGQLDGQLVAAAEVPVDAGARRDVSLTKESDSG